MDNQIAKFLEKIKLIESSGGSNTNHDEIQHGIHKGHSAYGSYGLMPNTIQELINRQKQAGPLQQDFKNIDQEDPNFVKAVLSARPDMERQLAEQLAEKLLNKTQGNEEMAAYGWNQGHNLPVERMTPEKIDEAQYIKKFREIGKKYGPKR